MCAAHSISSRKALRHFEPVIASSRILVFSLFLVLRLSAHGADTSETPAPAAATDELQTEWIMRQVLKDMMYGTDDFFGEDSDLAQVDSVVPAARGQDEAQDAEPTVSPDRDRPDDRPPPDIEPPPDEEPPPV